MAYSDFSLTKLQRLYGLNYDRVALFPRPHRRETASPFLLVELADSKLFPLLTEKAKSGFLIAPILRELARRNVDGFTVFSGFSLDVDETLNGFCDYLLSGKPRSIEPGSRPTSGSGVLSGRSQKSNGGRRLRAVCGRDAGGLPLQRAGR